MEFTQEEHNRITRFKKFVYSKARYYSDFAFMVGWQESKVNFIACGKQKVTIDLALELEKKFNLNPAWLVFGQGEMYISNLETIKKYKKKIKKYKKKIKKIREIPNYNLEIYPSDGSVPF